MFVFRSSSKVCYLSVCSSFTLIVCYVRVCLLFSSPHARSGVVQDSLTFGIMGIVNVLLQASYRIVLRYDLRIVTNMVTNTKLFMVPAGRALQYSKLCIYIKKLIYGCADKPCFVSLSTCLRVLDLYFQTILPPGS